MNGFDFFLNTRIDFGIGKLKNLVNHIKNLNSKNVFIVTDSNLVKVGLLDSIFKELEENSIHYMVYDKVKPNPDIENVDNGAKLCIENESDLIIAIGGGSCMDVSKGISVITKNLESSYDYLDGRGKSKASIKDTLPIIAIPTTSGTGSEVSIYSVITDYDRIKDSITSEKIYPKIALIDPNLMKNLPPYITACTGLDVLGHALEAYTSNIKNNLTDMFSLEAIKIVFDYLPEAVNKGTIESREKLAFASLIAGIAMSCCGSTIPHALGCPLSGHLDLPHGLTVGVLQIPMIEFNKIELNEEFERVVKYVNPKLTYKKNEVYKVLINMIEEIFNKINIELFLNNEIDDSTKELLLKDASIHGCLGLNKRKVEKKDIENIYKSIILKW
ncbi:iron-containing alcohol dehydrogenase [Clostridioides difficile]|nr:iron-containing alcohol dehydrogenase [Clostridioides difficile]